MKLYYNTLRQHEMEKAAEELNDVDLELYPSDDMPYSKCLLIDNDGIAITLEFTEEYMQ